MTPSSEIAVCTSRLEHSSAHEFFFGGDDWTLDRSAPMLVFMRILVTGDRFWTCPKLAMSIMRSLVARYGPGIAIIHGGGAGVDSSFASACRDLGISSEPHLAHWKGLGNIVVTVRHQDGTMLDSPARLPDPATLRPDPVWVGSAIRCHPKALTQTQTAHERTSQA